MNTPATATALIADDEEAPREQLAAALARLWPELRLVAASRNGAEAWDDCLALEPVLAFLDIRMPGLTGLEVARRLSALAAPPLATLAPPRSVPRPIQAGVGREVVLIPPDEVVYFEADARYTRVVHQGGDALIRTPLRELLTQLDPEQFWQIHRSVLVNSRCIARAVRIDEGNMVVTLRGRDEKLPVSRQFQPLFKGQ